MKAVIFYIFSAVNRVLTLLPLRVLYGFSPLFYFILYHLTGYRKQVVMNNLSNAFPEKSGKELKTTAKKFYRHLSDLFIEVLKLQHMKASEIRERYKLINPELFDKELKEGRSTIAVFGHYGNWEWIISLPLSIQYRTIMVYKPLSNKYFDRYFHRFRSQYGVELVQMAKTGRTLYRYEEEGINTLVGLLADQTPPRREIQYWTKFLNQDTPVYLGIEKLSNKFNMTVVFLHIDKVRRGYYEIRPEIISAQASELAPYELTEKHVSLLEEQIKRRPELWLWSHRRWKHKKPEDR
ncbi:MAG: lysophospholipid acyltransferase family protein [Bacteroidales bacterium]|jgi:KDO2-lipid IV(A) lauroyltransferase|nr:lysophospholipid acyltransferase family protein [Bacteroidales bacterium]